MTASKQQHLIGCLIETKKAKYGRFPTVKDAVRLLKKVDATIWGAIDSKFDDMVEWCIKKDLM